jgi:hypothetical protein
MRQARLQGLSLARRRRGRRRVPALLRLATLAAVALLFAYVVWPYATLWRLDAAARSADPAELAALVDIAAVRGEIKRKLNKDAASHIDHLSDGFIRWLQAGIASAGSAAVDRLVTLDWVRARLLGDVPGNEGILGRVSYAFFDAPDGLRVAVGAGDTDPVWLRLSLQGFSWRVTAVYY